MVVLIWTIDCFTVFFLQNSIIVQLKALGYFNDILIKITYTFYGTTQCTDIGTVLNWALVKKVNADKAGETRLVIPDEVRQLDMMDVDSIAGTFRADDEEVAQNANRSGACGR